MEPTWSGLGEFAAARGQALLRTAYALTGDAHAAEDLVQTALLGAAAAWPRIAADPEPYLRRAMVNAHISAWRRLRGTRLQPLDEHLSQHRADPDSGQATADRLALRTALSRLAPRQRTVLVLRYYDDMTEAQTAQLLGCSVGNVKRTAHTALKRLRQHSPEIAAWKDAAEETVR